MKNTRGVVIGGAAILLSAIFFLVPFLFSFVMASMTRTQANQLQFTWPQPFVLFDNLAQALAARDYLMIIAFINSFILTVVSVAALVILSAMVAYIWQRRPGRLSPVVNILVLAGLIVPPAVIMTVIILQAVLIYNDFQHPLYFLPGTENATVQLTLLNFQSQFTTQYNLLFATILLVTIPPLIMFIFFNRKIVEGMAAGSVKG
jgi:ABC-type glycerol-3-phosphate transport system permease component